MPTMWQQKEHNHYSTKQQMLSSLMVRQCPGDNYTQDLQNRCFSSANRKHFLPRDVESWCSYLSRRRKALSSVVLLWHNAFLFSTVFFAQWHCFAVWNFQWRHHSATCWLIVVLHTSWRKFAVVTQFSVVTTQLLSSHCVIQCIVCYFNKHTAHCWLCKLQEFRHEKNTCIQFCV